ncbi:penicillin-binding protein [Bifidobacterium actinocoloniiforme DSM 22766]|uniref:Penicillin-binding protein n=1 Tax=Bifidobacterium actinocoloniiforme DSM 22766 TaxID=1437605 RepID=A0A086Z2A0_9BIFI|nr:transglycosylase domain-containing protein [Bifidobacterium actinocoloniiforme]KFI40650.1 penicillin-binding protein [Bifidobacterium actinocoloniiforme DSM 22766]
MIFENRSSFSAPRPPRKARSASSAGRPGAGGGRAATFRPSGGPKLRAPRGTDPITEAGKSRHGAKRRGGSGPAKTPKLGRDGKPRKRHLILKWTLGILGFLLLAGVAAFAYLYLTTEVVPPEKQALAQKTTVYYADGVTPVGSFAEQNREIIPCSTLPKHMSNAIVASENRSFYSDNGIDLKGIGRALFNNVTKGTRQGGSTITQQYAERYYLGETTSYTGKLREAMLSLKIAQTEDKDTVLCNYMNTIYLGRGAYGIQAAAQAYYGKDAKDMTLPESAMLAGIIPAPTTWDPAVNPQQAQSRYKRVLGIMQEDGYISAKDKSEALKAPPKTIDYSPQNVYQGPNGYLLRMVRTELAGGKKAPFTADELDTGGYKIITTIDKSKQDLMYQVASPSVEGKRLPDGLQVGGMSVNPKDGSIISLYAGDDYLKHQLNNVSQARFQVGSTMKVFTLLGAIQSGVNLNTVFNGNSPRTFNSVGKSVANAEGISYGYVNLYSALANSVNTVFMDLNEHVTSQKTAQVAHAAGIEGKIDDTTTFDALGVDALTDWDLTQGYQTIANGGKKIPLHLVSQVKDTKDQQLYTASNQGEQVFNAEQVALLQKAMTGTVQYGTGTQARAVGKTIAAKTGTANDDTAASMAGFTPSVLTTFGIWQPGPDGSAQKVPNFAGYPHGSGYPTYLFTQYMKQATAGMADEKFPVAKDVGKVGGPDGTWGTGRASYSYGYQRSYGNTNGYGNGYKNYNYNYNYNNTQGGTQTTPNQQTNPGQQSTQPQTQPNSGQ